MLQTGFFFMPITYTRPFTLRGGGGYGHTKKGCLVPLLGRSNLNDITRLYITWR